MSAIDKPAHFIGYWGQTDLTKTLSILVPDYRIRSGKLSEWAIASASLLTADSVTLNACGRFQPTDFPGDAWAVVESGLLRLGRDPFGRVPLYWMRSQGTIWFSTQIQLLLPLIDVPEVSPIALHSYACFSYVPTPLSPIEQIASVAAGTEIVWQLADVNSPPKVRSLHCGRHSRRRLTARWIEHRSKLKELRDCNLLGPSSHIVDRHPAIPERGATPAIRHFGRKKGVFR